MKLAFRSVHARDIQGAVAPKAVRTGGRQARARAQVAAVVAMLIAASWAAVGCSATATPPDPASASYCQVLAATHNDFVSGGAPVLEADTPQGSVLADAKHRSMTKRLHAAPPAIRSSWGAIIDSIYAGEPVESSRYRTMIDQISAYNQQNCGSSDISDGI